MPDGKARAPLDIYRAKRSADSTPEPFGGEGLPRPGIFVIQKHAATRLHYDLRLEMNGVLRSFAIPKGPALDPAEKRFAAETEDHPIEYADFEGIIPKGNYGAGTMIVWDRGLWVSHLPIDESYAKGKLLFELRGYKMGGLWTLVRTKAGPKDWLLIKKPDAYARPAGTPQEYSEASVLSGLTIEELSAGSERGATIRASLAQQGALERTTRTTDIGLMLAESAPKPFSRPGWIFELKYDGFRLLAARENGAARLVLRGGGGATSTFPEIALALTKLPYGDLVIDGEVTVLDDTGRPSFRLLQKRVHLSRPADIQRATVDLPAVLYAFDLLAFEGLDTRSLPLLARKDALRQLLPREGPLRWTDHVEERGAELYEAVVRHGAEGIMGKRADAPYRAGRGRDWLKVRAERTGDFAIIGYTLPKGGMSGFGALHLAVTASEGLVYAGRVGTGFDDRLRDTLWARLQVAPRTKSLAAGAPKSRDSVWIQPDLVCEVRYLEWPEESLLRQPVFLRLRGDKTVAECVHEGRGESEGGESRLPSPVSPPPSPVPAQPPEPVRNVAFSRREKVFWPDEGYTKGDLIDYYRAISPWLLPYLKDRPVVLTRYPDGITGKSFYQKDAPGFVPGWLRTERIWSESTKREIDYFVCDNVESLLFLANLGTIPLHVWSSRVGSIAAPDWSILDLDPKGAPFADVVAIALAIRRLCDAIELPTFVKTSGSTGLHVLVPLAGQCTFDQSRSLALLLARLIADEMPEIATITRAVRSRGGRVYIDALQNAHGQLLVSPFSVRPLPGAPVSTPLSWSEVGPRLALGKHTIRTVPRRFDRLKHDPFAPVLTTRVNLPAVLERLLGRTGGS